MIEIFYEKANNRSAAYDGDKIVGEATYIIVDGKWELNHTFVDKEYGGQGIAKKLIKKLADEARIERVKVIPVCSFAQKEFAQNEEYQDLL